MTWLTGWQYRRSITITEQSGSDLTDYQVKIELNSSNFDFSKANADGSDIRFAADDGTTLLPYWIEEWDSVNQTAKIWVKIPSLLANSSITIYMYYGNPNAISESNPDAVFDFYDDFEGTSLDTSKWEAFARGGNYSVANSYVTLSPVPNQTNAVALRSNIQFVNDIIVEAKVNPQSDTYYDMGLTTVQSISTGLYHPAGSNYGYYITAQWVTSSQYGYRLSTTTPSGTTSSDYFGGGQTLQEIIYQFAYLSDGTVIGQVEFLDGTIWATLQATDTTYLNDPKYVVIWQGEYARGDGAPSSWDWVRVRKYAAQEPTFTVSAEEEAGVGTYSITIVEGMTLVSSPAKQLSGVQQIALTLTLAEDLQKVLPLLVSNTDNITLNESLSKKKLVRKLLSEIITLTEDLAKQGVLNLPLSELLFLDEDTTTAGDFKSGLVDNVTLVEAIFYIKQLNSILKESININEVTAFTSLMNKILSDLVNLIENVDLKSGSGQYIVDTLSLSEERRLNLLSALVDSVVLQELLTKVYTTFIQNIENIHLSEKTERRIGINYSEAITLLDTIIKELKIILYDNIALNEFITYHLTASLLTEIMLNEAQQGSAYLTEQILDTLGLSDQIDVIHQLLTIFGEYNLVSLILTAKLLNSDIETLKKIYSLISNVKRLGGY